MNGDTINNLSQAIATLLAVILAYLLSILTDRSSWKHRKKEQIREHQLDSVKNLVQLMQKIDYIFHYLVELKTNTLEEVSSATSLAIRTNKIESAKSDIKSQLLSLNELKVELYREYWELKLLKYEADQNDIIMNYIKSFENVVLTLESISDPVNDSTLCEDLFTDIKDLFTLFINEAEDGLTK